MSYTLEAGGAVGLPSGATLGGTGQNSTGSTYSYAALFNGTLNTQNDCWGHFTTSFPKQITITFSSGKVLTKYGLWPRTNQSQSPKNFEFRGSNDGGSTYTTLDTRTNITSWASMSGASTNYSSHITNNTNVNEYTFTNTTSYTTYILHISSVNNIWSWDGATLGEIALYSTFPYVLEAGAGSLNGSGGAQGTVTDTYNHSTTNYQKDKAFDGDTQYRQGAWVPAGHSLTFQFPSAKTITMYRIWLAQNRANWTSAKDFTLQGSNDGSSFTTVDTVSNRLAAAWPTSTTTSISTMNSSEFSQFTVDSPGSYTYYRISVTAVNNTYTQNWFGEVAYYSDVVTVPDAPTNLAASVASNTSVNLSWTAPSGTVDSYKIERSTDNSNWVTIVATHTSGTSYTNTGLTTGATYYYRVSATNSEGTGSSTSAVQVVAAIGNGTGGTVTTHGVYKVHTFTSSGTLTIYGAAIACDFLLVGGGGGGQGRTGGGGGGGGVVVGTSQTLSTGSYSVVVGGGGAGGAIAGYGDNNNKGLTGSDSTFNSFTAKGGGGSGGNGASSVRPGQAGGSGGGATYNSAGGSTTQDTYSGTSGVTGYGNAGGSGVLSGVYGSGGGGGAGAVGGSGTGSAGGNGGNGIQNDFRTGSNIYYGGGGGGGIYSDTTDSSPATGGLGGGGGAGTSSNGAGIDGTANTGGGGGSSRQAGPNTANTGYGGGDGGSGIFVLRYVAPSITLPGSISGLSLNASVANQITASWNAPSDNGGDAIAGYKVEVSYIGGEEFEVLSANTGSATTNYVFPEKVGGGDYSFRISAINSVGTGASLTSTPVHIPIANTHLLISSVGSVAGTRKLDRNSHSVYVSRKPSIYYVQGDTAAVEAVGSAPAAPGTGGKIYSLVDGKAYFKSSAFGGSLEHPLTNHTDGLKLASSNLGIKVSPTQTLTVGGDASITGTLITSGLTFPSGTGSSSQYLGTNGSGTLTFQSVSGSGSLPALVPTRTSILSAVLSSANQNINDEYRYYCWNTSADTADLKYTTGTTQGANSLIHIKGAGDYLISSNLYVADGGVSGGSGTWMAVALYTGQANNTTRGTLDYEYYLDAMYNSDDAATHDKSLMGGSLRINISDAMVSAGCQIEIVSRRLFTADTSGTSNCDASGSKLHIEKYAYSYS